MKVFVLTGHGKVDLAAVWSICLDLGIAPAAPAKRDTEHPDLFHDTIWRTLGIQSPDDPGQMQLGPLWRRFAEDLLLNNISQEAWGWADARSSRLLHFLAGIDPSVHFLLAYCSPEHVLFEMIRHRDMDSDAVAVALTRWKDKNSQLLDFYRQFQDRCCLLDAQAAVSDPIRFREVVARRFGVGGGGNLVCAPAKMTSRRLLPFLFAAAASHPDVREFHEELQRAADLPGVAAPTEDDFLTVLHEYRDLYQSAERAHELESKLQIARESVSRERDAGIQLRERGLELERAIAEGQKSEERLIIENKSLTARLKEQQGQIDVLLKDQGRHEEEIRQFIHREQEFEKDKKSLILKLEQKQREYLANSLDLQKKISSAKPAAPSREKELLKEKESLLLQLRKRQERLDRVLQREKELEAALGHLRRRQDEMTRENDELARQLHQMQEQREGGAGKGGKRVSASDASLPAARPAEDSEGRPGPDVRDNRHGGGLLSSSLERWKARRRIRRQAEIIRQSGLFDEQWYTHQYPEATASKMDPIQHYLKFGVEKELNPSAFFDTGYYLRAYPDVAASSMNPFLHYIKHGRDEERAPNEFSPGGWMGSE
ncbi:hypothetical protein [Desulfolutivibrio sulfoxidireducens]|uniref:hypothetical protein n=1 Tax=Desulfolutivibrio sulfoxidireducens TaxID=2773299 RepID=UPI00159E10DC|nr:hypothetical protein [Desulfolutivibrio sulfoxidireducens]QLA16762.1 hypothetical protein GD605_12015 [Desulfolutivibrio sulfoxidireducens]QLA20326.1 hypothetical protein GD604_11715 [Desulfolutivibrio sulfoxidireducens]